MGKVHVLLSPLILASNLIFLLRGEVILNIKGLADLLRGLPFDHVGDSFASNIEKSLDIKVIGSLNRIICKYMLIKKELYFIYKNNLKQHLLINLHELLIPLIDIGGLLA